MSRASSDDPPAPRRRCRRLPDVVAGLLLLGFTAIACLYAARVPGFDPVTVWPFMLWAGLFMAPAIILAPLLRLTRTLLVAGVVLGAALLLCEEMTYLFRVASQHVAVEPGRDDLLRVITLNCGGGDSGAVRDALAQDADIILLQESPGGSAIERLLPPGWQQAGRGNCAVLVRGEAYADEHSRYLAHEMFVARLVPARLTQPTPITVISTHLVQPSLRTDIWRRSVWREAEALRAARMKTIESLLRERSRYGGDLPAIIGGDFNTGDHDTLLEPLELEGFTDAFAAAGVGWPNTITADFPVERIDYVWTDDRFEPLKGFVEVTAHSDHRMVVVDVALR